jgi:hypothetical protein
MRTDSDRRIARELTQWQREQAAHGVAPSEEQQRIERVKLARKHSQFPFAVFVAIATALAALAGILRTRAGHDQRLHDRVLVRSIVIALASIVAVIVLDGVLPG